MGLTKTRLQALALLFPLLALTAVAAPKLRLVTTTVGPISVAANTNGPNQMVEAYNAGDGSLVLQSSSNSTWLVPTAMGPVPCSTRAGSCIPIRLELRTSGLARGTYTATVTVADPNALDAPQTITVTVQIGGGVPDSVTQYVAPGRTAHTTISSNSSLGYRYSTQSGGDWLSIGSEAGGTYRSVYSYDVRMSPPPSTPEGTYSGTVNFSSSAISEENKAMNATMRVTNGPILRVPSRVALKLRTNSGKGLIYVPFSNDGGGTLTIGSYAATTTNGGNWLSVETPAFPGLIQINADSTALNPGRYTGEVRVASNAANGSAVVMVDLEVVTQTAPMVTFGGIVNVGSYDPTDTLAPGTWVELYGEQLSFQQTSPQSAPFPTVLGGTRVLVGGVAAPIWISSSGQINFQIPYETVAGEAIVQVEREGQTGNRLSVPVAASAPRIRKLRGTQYGIIVNNSDGTLAVPQALGGRPSQRGEYLVIYVVGFGQTNPPVESGAAAPSDPLSVVPSPTKVIFGNGPFGGISQDVLFAGLTPGFAGLYQVNVQIPMNAPVGESVPISVQSGSVRSPSVHIAVQ